jgi:hypothetical protein
MVLPRLHCPSSFSRVRCWTDLEITLAGSSARRAPATANGRCHMYAMDTLTALIASSSPCRLCWEQRPLGSANLEGLCKSRRPPALISFLLGVCFSWFPTRRHLPAPHEHAELCCCGRSMSQDFCSALQESGTNVCFGSIVLKSRVTRIERKLKHLDGRSLDPDVAGRHSTRDFSIESAERCRRAMRTRMTTSACFAPLTVIQPTRSGSPKRTRGPR